MNHTRKLVIRHWKFILNPENAENAVKKFQPSTIRGSGDKLPVPIDVPGFPFCLHLLSHAIAFSLRQFLHLTPKGAILHHMSIIMKSEDSKHEQD